MNEEYEIMFEEFDYRNVIHNTKMFRKINGLSNLKFI